MQRARVGDERLDDAFVGGGRELAVDAAALLGHQRVEATRALAHRLDEHQRVGERVVAHRAERVLGVEHRDVEGAEALAQLGLALAVLGARVAQPLDARLQPADLVPGEVQPDRAQLVDDPAVAARGVGLALQRRELAAHLAQQVVQPEQVALGRLEPALGALAALAVLQDPGGFLDDRAAILGTRVQHRVELALARR